MTPLILSKIAELHAEDFREDFPAWLQANYPIYFEFERQALLVALFRDNYSARTIAEVIRHNSQLAEVGGAWKINNNRIPCMARLFSITHPEHAGFFQLRDSDMRLGLAA